VSFLAVGFRVATISPVAAIMAQQKWTWMSREPRPLLDLEHIDNASNTITGSTHLLLHGPRSLMALLGSATLLLALAIGPLVQQAIHMVTCDQTVPGKNASVPVANYFRNGLPYRFRVVVGPGRERQGDPVERARESSGQRHGSAGDLLYRKLRLC
jgi:hypothetical protein